MYKLSICIPTYNGKEKLSYTLPALLKMTEGYDVQICISDNCSTDGTGEFVQRLGHEHKNIKYHKQVSNLGFAKNYEDVLKMGDGLFCWLMGDDDLPVDFSNFYKNNLCGSMTNDSSIYFVNGNNDNNRFSPVLNQSKIDLNQLISDYGWVATWISRYIISRDIAQKNNISSYSGAFPHVAWLFHLLDVSESNLYIINDVHIMESDIVSCSYSSRVYEFFVSDYFNLIKPYFDKLSKSEIKSFLSFSEQRMVKFRTLCRLRAEKKFSLKDVRKASEGLRYFSLSFKFKSYLVALCPVFLFSLPYKVYKKSKNRHNDKAC